MSANVRSYLLERPQHQPRHPIVWTLPLDVDGLRGLIEDCLARGSALMVWVPAPGPGDDRSRRWGPARVLGWERGRASVLIRFGGKEAPLEPLSLDLLCAWAGDRSERAA